MENAEGAALARVCRAQAKLATSEDTRAVLLELADLYERKESEEDLVPARLTEAPE